MMRVIIIDDDPMFRELLAKYLSNEEVEICGKFNNPIEAMPLLKNNGTDLIFLDLHMPEMKGSEFLETFGSSLPPVILTTSDPDYAITAFSYNVIGYLVKPFAYADFKKAIDKAFYLQAKRPAEKLNSDVLFVKKNGAIQRIDKKDIQYLECVGDYASIHTKEDKFIIHGSMKSLENTFSEPDFIRVHRSFIVRFDKIECIEEDSIIFKDKAIPVGKTYKQEVFARIKTV